MSTGLPGESKGKVIVVGAGVSGLTSAYRLQQAGFSVRVLEAENRAGGKTRTLRKDGFMLEQGATIVPSAYTRMLAIIEELGMSDQLSEGGTIIGFARGKDIHHIDSAHFYRDSIKTKFLSFKSKLLMLKAMLKYIRINKYLNYENLSTAAPFDVETAAEYCDRELNDEIKEYIVDSTLRGALATSAKINSVVDFFFSSSKILGTRLYSFRNGNDCYAKKLVELLDDVQLGARVSQVEESLNDVRVAWLDESGAESVENADACVLALNAHATSSLFPQLDDWSHQFLKGLKYTTAITVNVALSRPPVDNRDFLYMIPESVHPGVGPIEFVHNKSPHAVPTGKAALCIYPMSDWCESLMQEDDDTISEKVIAAAESIIPRFSSDIEFVAVNKWGPMSAYFRPGDYRNLGRFMEERKKYKRVKLAGDYFTSANMNTAVTAGERAAREIVEHFC